MDYYRILYETTAYLLMLRVQSGEYPFSTTVYRYFEDSAMTDKQERAVESVAILLALDRNGEQMYADIIDRLEQNIAELRLDSFPEAVRADIEADLKTAKNVIDWYRTTDGKIF